jgi:hypothetical protein
MCASSRPAAEAAPWTRRSWALVFCLGLMAPISAAPAVEEPELKAAIVFNLLLFIDWPPGREPSQSNALALCMRSGSPLQAPLERLSGRMVRNARLEVRVLGPAAAAVGCHALYTDGDESERARMARVAETARAVVIADDTPQANDATSVQLRRLERKLGFDINMPALRAAGVQVSSKLLRLARVIHE